MRLLHVLLLTLLLSACTTPNQNPAAGIYYGFLPCADCPGISYSLDLRNDGSYELQRFYNERSGDATIDRGTYTVRDGRLSLTGQELADLQLGDGQLIVLDKSGQPVAGDLADRYALTHNKPNGWQMEATDMKNGLPEQPRADVFRALGNEPFWSVAFTETEMIFDGLDLDSLTVPLASPTPAADREVYAYRGRSAAGELTVTLIPGNCDDSMADRSYAFTARASVLRAGETAPTVYEGCGDFSSPAPLDGKWRVTSLNGREPAGTKQSPTLTVDAAAGQLSGSTGCNRFSGSFAAETGAGGTFQTGPLVTTKKMCPPDNPEREFLQIMNGDDMRYRLLPGRLYLRYQGQRMELVR